MTTRHHKTLDEKAADVYRPLLRRLEAKVAKDEAQLQKDKGAVEALRKKIDSLCQLPMPMAGRNLVGEVTHPIAISIPPSITTASHRDERIVCVPRPMSEWTDALEPAQICPDRCPICGSDPGHKINCPRGSAFTTAPALAVPRDARTATPTPAAEPGVLETFPEAHISVSVGTKITRATPMPAAVTEREPSAWKPIVPPDKPAWRKP